MISSFTPSEKSWKVGTIASSASVVLKGRLIRSLKFWATLRASELLIQALERGLGLSHDSADAKVPRARRAKELRPVERMVGAEWDGVEVLEVGVWWECLEGEVEGGGLDKI